MPSLIDRNTGAINASDLQSTPNEPAMMLWRNCVVMTPSENGNMDEVHRFNDYMFDHIFIGKSPLNTITEFSAGYGQAVVTHK
jgi:hypothetical protein